MIAPRVHHADGRSGCGVAGSRCARSSTRCPMIGHLNSTSPNTYSKYTDAFRRGLQSTGYVEGQTRQNHTPLGGRSRNDRLPALAADLVRNQVAVIAATREPLLALSRPRPRPGRSQLYLSLAAIRSLSNSLIASIGQEAISRELAF